uniref:Ubiquitin carboxyl-terminal hydrolase n=1 Tax=Chromera velia CCMP2878 TaxID=1169474 RepID=A0A0G4ICL9_9ALVE|eukprot:Cvel_13176.t1-p1 / transcript=Cvel_13176.t1 / gene=Cvel_13176 / organism=Chromera_velia_CCMP2878 / gene_product=hypothetical protein / transcript_product=hypothetical protein / location=Cvel_scaffold890:6820-15938(+) / protein_length=745 / sequence_SO=supercontig / SO=protein_coding / is_pseudo=false
MDTEQDHDAELQQAISLSLETIKPRAQFRKTVMVDGCQVVLPCGLLNAGNSCYFNCLLQTFFFMTPIFRGALYQYSVAVNSPGHKSRLPTTRTTSSPRASSAHPQANTQMETGMASDAMGSPLALLRHFFAKMDLTVQSSIDVSPLYKEIFGGTDQQDASEQREAFLQAINATNDPVIGRGFQEQCFELFSGKLFEKLRGEHRERATPMEFCQFDLHVAEDTDIYRALSDFVADVHGSVERKRYDLPPVLWLNVDSFEYDRVRQESLKRRLRFDFSDSVSVADVLHADALNPEFLRQLRATRIRLASLEDSRLEHIAALEEAVQGGALSNQVEELVNLQEGLNQDIEKEERNLRAMETRWGLLYSLRAVIVHRGRCDGGHYWVFCKKGRDERDRRVAGSSHQQPPQILWYRCDDAEVRLCSSEELWQEVCNHPPVPHEVLRRQWDAERLREGKQARGGGIGGGGSEADRLTCLSPTAPRCLPSGGRESGGKGGPATAAVDRSDGVVTGAYCLIYVRLEGAAEKAAGMDRDVAGHIPASLAKKIEDEERAFLRERVAEAVRIFQRLSQAAGFCSESPTQGLQADGRASSISPPSSSSCAVTRGDPKGVPPSSSSSFPSGGFPAGGERERRLERRQKRDPTATRGELQETQKDAIEISRGLSAEKGRKYGLLYLLQKAWSWTFCLSDSGSSGTSFLRPWEASLKGLLLEELAKEEETEVFDQVKSARGTDILPSRVLDFFRVFSGAL